MNSKLQLLFSVIFSLYISIQYSSAISDSNIPISSIKDKVLTKIAFASCNKEERPQVHWKTIVEQKPDLFLWLGDIVYADTHYIPSYWHPSPLEEVTAKYNLVKENPDYKKLLKTCPVTGAWDDHDFNNNNGGNNYDGRQDVQKIILDFLDEPKESKRWNREGIYTSYTFGPEGKKVKIIILDTRYFRDLNPDGEPIGDMLGEIQWKWFEEELSSSDAQINLITSGIQILPHDKPIEEKWSNFPQSRKRLLELLKKTKASGVVLMSGDIHYGEILRHSCAGTKHPLYEITSSGLTHCCGDIPFGICQFMLNNVMISKHHVGTYEYFNFGTIEIDWESKPVSVKLQVRDTVNGFVKLEQIVKLNEKYEVNPIDCEVEGEVPKWKLYSSDTLRDFLVNFVILPSTLFWIFICWRCCCSSKKNRITKPKSN